MKSETQSTVFNDPSVTVWADGNCSANCICHFSAEVHRRGFWNRPELCKLCLQAPYVHFWKTWHILDQHGWSSKPLGNATIYLKQELEDIINRSSSIVVQCWAVALTRPCGLVVSAYHVPGVVGKPVDGTVTASDEMKMFGFDWSLIDEEHDKWRRHKWHGADCEYRYQHVWTLLTAFTHISYSNSWSGRKYMPTFQDSQYFIAGFSFNFFQ